MNPYKGATRATQAFVDEAAWRYDLDRYDAINRSLVTNPIRPGYVFEGSRLVLRGEFVDVPKRFLDLGDRREGFGDVDDRAHEFGFEDGDELVAWMQTAKRPRRADYIAFRRPKDQSKKRMRKARKNLPEGHCHCCLAPKDSEKHWLCNERAKERVARARETAKEAAA